MPRQLRELIAGGIYHVWARGNRRELIFRGDADFRLYTQLLAGTVAAKKWRLLAYCLMPNHVHLLIETPEPNLARGMQYLHGSYARLFNESHNFVGHVFQGRYGTKLVRDDVQLGSVARYIAANPVAARLCREPADRQWSSFHRSDAEARPAWMDRDRFPA